MVAECAVLRGIKHLKQCRRRVAVEVHCDLVDLIQQKHGVLRLRAANALDDAPRHCTDIGAAMPADLRLVADAAERDADELASHCARNRRAERGLANTWGTHKTENRCTLLGGETAHGEIVEDALLDLLKTVVVMLKHRLRLCHIDVLLRRLVPREFGEGVEIVADDTNLRTHRRTHVEAVNLALDGFAYGFGILLCRQCLTVAVNLCRLVCIVTELFADCLDLLAQVEVPLYFVHLLANAAVDLALDAHDVEFVHECLIEAFETRTDVDCGKDFLPHLMLQAQMARDDVCKSSHVLHDGDGDKRLGWNLM